MKLFFDGPQGNLIFWLILSVIGALEMMFQERIKCLPNAFLALASQERGS